MAKSKNSKRTEKNEKRSKQKVSRRGKTTREIVQRHLNDENDKITEDDFKELRIDLSLPPDHAHEPLPIPSDKERPKDVDKDNTIITPWDVINE